MSSVNISAMLQIQYFVRGNGNRIGLEPAGNSWSRNSSSDYINSAAIQIPVDPLTAILSGAVRASELNLPPGLEAALNMLK